MPRLVEEEENDASQTDEAVLIKHGKAPKYAPQPTETHTVQPGKAVTVDAAHQSADPTLPFALVAVVALVFFALFFTAVGFLFRRQLLYPMLHQLGITDEFGNPLMKAPWHR